MAIHINYIEKTNRYRSKPTCITSLFAQKSNRKNPNIVTREREIIFDQGASISKGADLEIERWKWRREERWKKKDAKFAGL